MTMVVLAGALIFAAWLAWRCIAMMREAERTRILLEENVRRLSRMTETARRSDRHRARRAVALEKMPMRRLLAEADRE